MTKALGLRGRGRPKGVKNKEKPPAAPLKNSRMLSLMEGCYTAEEWLKRFQKLSPSEQFKLKASVEPKVREEGAVTSIQLIIRGMSGWTCEKCGHPQSGKGGPGEELHPAEPIDSPGCRAFSSPTESSKGLPHARSERCAELRDRPLPHRPLQEEDPPVRGPVFVVPSFEDDRTPPEWREPLYDEEEL